MMLKWKLPHKETPPSGVRLLCKFKHGVIDCFFDDERFNKSGEFIGTTYIWSDLEFYIYEWMLFSEFESCFEKEIK